MKKKKGDCLCLPFSKIEEEESSFYDGTEMARRMQASVYADFNARRNAIRIDRYFIKSRTKIVATSITMISAIVFIILIVVCIMLSKNLYDISLRETLDKLMTSTRQLMFTATVDLFFETSFVANVFAVFLEKPAILPLNITGATNITQLFRKAMLSSKTDNSFSYDVGLYDGSLISIQKNQHDDNYLLFYANTSNVLGFIHPMATWYTDKNAYNETYPYYGGIEEGGNYDASTRGWYKMTQLYNHSIWSQAYIGMGNMENIPLLTGTSPINDGNRLLGVIAIAMKFGEVQVLIDSKLPTVNSRFAVVREDDTLIAVSGSDNAVDIYKGEIIRKNVNQLHDPVWSVIVKDPKFQQEENYTAEYIIDGEKRTYSVSQIHWEAAPNAIWTFYSLVCASDFFDDSIIQINISYFIIVLCAGILIIILMLIMIIINRHLVDAEQTKFLNNNDEYSARHIRPYGINIGMNSLKKLRLSHSDNPEVQSTINEVISDLQSITKVVYYDPRPIYSTINNQVVMKKLIDMYGEPDLIVEKRIRSSRASSKVGNNHDSMSIGSLSSVSAFEANSFKQRTYLFKIDISTIPNSILDLFSHYNNVRNYFDEQKLNEIITSSIENMNPKLLPLVIDSLSFAHIVLQWRIQEHLIEEDYCLALLFTIICWHIAMNDRTNSENEMIDRYFLQDKVKYRTIVKNLLLQLYDIRIDTEQKRWNVLVTIIMKIVHIAPLINQHEVLSNISLFYLNIISGQKLSDPESTMLAQLVFISSTISFFFHSPEISRKSREFMNGDFETNESAINHFLNCVFNVHVNLVSDALNEICDAKFMRHFHET